MASFLRRWRFREVFRRCSGGFGVFVWGNGGNFGVFGGWNGDGFGVFRRRSGDRCRLGEFRGGGGGVGIVALVATVWLFIQAANTSRFFVPVRTHIVIVIVLVPSGLVALAMPFPLSEEEGLGVSFLLLLFTGDDTAATQLGGFGGVTQGCAIGAFSSKNCRFVFFPVTLAEMEPTVLGPEEEPDASQDKAGS